MPWTRKQVKLLLSKASPLSRAQKAKMKAELHQNPKLGHAKKGSQELKKPAAKPRVERRIVTESHAYNWRMHRGGRRPKPRGNG